MRFGTKSRPTSSSFWRSRCTPAYAFLTVLAATLPVRRPYFWAVVIVLAMHGVGTEIGQTYVPGRGGSKRDVAIDWVGVGLGLLTLHGWKSWRS